MFVLMAEGALFMAMACVEAGMGPWPGGPGRPGPPGGVPIIPPGPWFGCPLGFVTIYNTNKSTFPKTGG